MKQKRILIAGASGTAGSTIATVLAASEKYQVYGLTHKAENQAPIQQAGCIPVLADLTDSEQTREAVVNAQPEVIISSVMGSGPEASKQELVMGDNLIRIAQEVHAGFVYLSVFEADKNTGVPHFDVKAKIESQLRSSGLKCFIIRPATFMDGLFMPWFLQPVKEQDVLASPMTMDTRISYIHTHDIGELILYALQQGFAGETYTIGGKALSIGDILHILSQRLNKNIAYRPIPLGQVEQMMGNDITLMINYFNNHGFVVPTNILPRGFTPQLKNFEEEIVQYL